MNRTHVKNIFLLIICFGVSIMLYAQKTKTSTTYETCVNVYRESLRLNDLAVARAQVLTILVLRPEEKNWNDSLTILYFSSAMYEQSTYMGKEILKSRPGDQLMLELVATSQANLGMDKEALEDFEKLFAFSKNPLHQYKIATLQYKLQRYGECSATLSQMMQNQALNNEKVDITVSSQKIQRISMMAALWNVAGMLNLETGHPDDARTCFKEALKLEPEFELPKSNLVYLDSKK